MGEHKMSVGVIGIGERFDSLVALLQANGCLVKVWRPDGFAKRLPKGCKKATLEQFDELHLIYIAVPLTRLREVARELGNHITPRHAIIHACHNLEQGTLATASEVLLEETPTRRVGFLTGPMRSEDVHVGLPASGVCASRFPELWSLAEESLVHERFRLYRCKDLTGAEHAAAYGRVIAMAAGVASQMSLGASVQATLFARGLAEVARWVKACGGEERTTFGISGAGNLYLDASNHGSVDFQVGADGMATGVFDPKKVAKKFGSTGSDLLDLVTSLWEGVSGCGIHGHILEMCQLMVSGELDPPGAVLHLMTLPTLDD